MAIYLTEDEVGRLIDMPTALAAVEAAHAALATGDAIDIPRQRVRSGTSMQHMLQGSWPARGVMGYKIYTTSAAGVRFWLHLFDSRSGEPLAVMEANLLGMMRTGAAGGVAARRLAREAANCAGIIGAGWQARGQILALACAVHVDRFKVFVRNRAKLEKFCADMSTETGCAMQAVATAQEAAEASDIIVTATTSPVPVLEGAWLAPGMHVNAMGSNSLVRRELDEVAVGRMDVICVDGVDTALKEAGDLLPALEKGRLSAGRLLALGDLVAGFRVGRTDAQQITLFESQGMAIQDIALGFEVFQRAKSAGIGRALPY
ncbi:MAG TPA: ornithine cyclodeaminase family protein [Rhodocyclaceae bacterium]|nr:ornithine cyclodeaminase family protein [Rhodocyclaceae bacterium]